MVASLSYFFAGIAAILFFGLHVWVFSVNKYVYGILICVFLVLYAAAVLVFTARNKGCFMDTSVSFINYLSLYIITLQVFMGAFIIYRWITRVSKPKDA